MQNTDRNVDFNHDDSKIPSRPIVDKAATVAITSQIKHTNNYISCLDERLSPIDANHPSGWYFKLEQRDKKEYILFGTWVSVKDKPVFVGIPADPALLSKSHLLQISDTEDQYYSVPADLPAAVTVITNNKSGIKSPRLIKVDDETKAMNIMAIAKYVDSKETILAAKIGEGIVAKSFIDKNRKFMVAIITSTKDSDMTKSVRLEIETEIVDRTMDKDNKVVIEYQRGEYHYDSTIHGIITRTANIEIADGPKDTEYIRLSPYYVPSVINQKKFLSKKKTINSK